MMRGFTNKISLCARDFKRKRGILLDFCADTCDIIRVFLFH